MKGFFIADVTLAVILVLLLIANFAVVFKLKTYKSFSPGFVSIGIILLLLAREIQLCYMSSHEENPYKVNNWDFSRAGRILTDIAFYLFSIVSFALLLQWFWTFEILHDPVKAVNQNNSHYFTKVLGIVFFCSLIVLVMVIVFDCVS